MATDVQIASLALTRIGHEGITSFSSSGDKSERWFQANYEFIKQALLREFQWRFAIKRAVLAMDRVRLIAGVSSTNPVVVTSAGHGFTNGQEVYIDSLVGMYQLNGRTFTVAGQTANTFALAGIDGTGYTAYSSGGSAYAYVAREYRYRFQLPSDCLRLLRINGGEWDDYRVEQGYVFTNEGSVHIEYIFDVTDEASFDSQFTDLLAARLSAEVCFYLTDNSTLTEQAWKIYNDKLSLARTMDSRQGRPRGIEADLWLNARA